MKIETTGEMEAMIMTLSIFQGNSLHARATRLFLPSHFETQVFTISAVVGLFRRPVLPEHKFCFLLFHFITDLD
ncbi:unnamed protein product [Victoria cruziana]